MIRILPAAVAALILASAAPAQAGQICGWLTETVDAENLHDFALWLEADAEANIFYRMTGEGIVTESSRNYGPGSGTYVLHAGRAARVWSFGGTLNPPADIDIVAQVHRPPKSIFDEGDPPLIAAFTFRRHVAEDEGPPPKDFATRRCAPLP